MRADGAAVARATGESGAGADIGAGCDGRMPFTSGSGRAGLVSGLIVGMTVASSTGTVTSS
jgi:hypothetical protein